jgi:hypothetical protein
MGFLQILSLLAGLGQGVFSVGKAIKTSKNDRMTKEYEQEIKDFNEKQKEKKEREMRRQALARAIGADVEFSPQPDDKPPKEPNYGDTTGFDIASGITNVVGTGAQGASGMIKDTPAPAKDASIGTLNQIDTNMQPTNNRYARYAKEAYKYS